MENSKNILIIGDMPGYGKMGRLPPSPMMGSVTTRKSSLRWLSMKPRSRSTWSAEARKPVVTQSN